MSKRDLPHTLFTSESLRALKVAARIASGRALGSEAFLYGVLEVADSFSARALSLLGVRQSDLPSGPARQNEGVSDVFSPTVKKALSRAADFSRPGQVPDDVCLPQVSDQITLENLTYFVVDETPEFIDRFGERPAELFSRAFFLIAENDPFREHRFDEEFDPEPDEDGDDDAYMVDIVFRMIAGHIKTVKAGLEQIPNPAELPGNAYEELCQDIDAILRVLPGDGEAEPEVSFSQARMLVHLSYLPRCLRALWEPILEDTSSLKELAVRIQRNSYRIHDCLKCSKSVGLRFGIL